MADVAFFELCLSKTTETAPAVSIPIYRNRSSRFGTDLPKPLSRSLDPDHRTGGHFPDVLHFLHGCGGIGTVEHRRARHHPVTPRLNDTLQIIPPDSAIYLDRKHQAHLLTDPHQTADLTQHVRN